MRKSKSTKAGKGRSARGVGRPSAYKPEYCEALVLHMTEGLSFESFGGVIGKSKDTLYEWAKTHVEFSDAKKRGETASQLVWEKLGLEGVKGIYEGFNATVWIFNMKNRFAWRNEKPSDDDEEKPNDSKEKLGKLFGEIRAMVEDIRICQPKPSPPESASLPH